MSRAPLPSARLPALRAAWLGLLLGTAAAAASAEPARYRLDPVHTRVLFEVSHAGFSQALGTISGSNGVLEFDPSDWSSARLDVSVPLQGLDLGDARWNQATLARNLLDAGRWPQARFVSQRVVPREDGGFTVHGLLTLRGVAREVALEVGFNGLRRHPLPPFRRTAGFSAQAVLSRSEFGIDAWKSMIGDEVRIRIEAEAVRERGSLDPDRADDDGDPADEQDSSAPAGTNALSRESPDP